MLIFKHLRPQDVGINPTPAEYEICPVSPDNTRALFTDCGDFTERWVSAGGTGVPVFLCWLDGTVSGEDVASTVIRPLSDPKRFGHVKNSADVAAALDGGLVYGCDMRAMYSLRELSQAIAYGCCAAVLEGVAFVFQLKTSQHRSVQEPTVEKTVKGSKDAFIETLRVNTALLRSRLRTPQLKLRQLSVGQNIRTDTAVMWLEDRASPEIPARVEAILGQIGTEGPLRPDDLDSAFSACPGSPFPQLLHTERPDRLAAYLAAGKVCVLAEGIPVAFVMPACLRDFMTTGEDAAQHCIPASFLRLLRWSAMGISLFLPALYVAMASYHPEMVPTELLLSVIHSKQSVPFSTTAEILGMLLSFELLQEAGLRLPDPVGQTVSIIGALIVGQSAVEAKVISPIAVIVVALAGIAGYTSPSQDLSMALRLCRLLLVILAAVSGLFGTAAGGLVLLWHLCSLEFCGRSYVADPDAEPLLLKPAGHGGEEGP